MTIGTLTLVHDTPVLVCPPDGPPLRTDSDALGIIGDAFGQGAELVALPAERLPAEFFTLRSRLAGEIAQKFVNYRIRLVVIGDITARFNDNPNLQAFVTEANRGRALWFLADLDELAARLATPPASG